MNWTPTPRAHADTRVTPTQTREWQQRGLLRKGARLYSQHAWTDDFMSLAMLDDSGVVVGWYARSSNATWQSAQPLRGHVSQLYTAEDSALGIPARDLASTLEHGESEQTGWRVGVDGGKFWAATTISAVLMRDGRLQGYSYLIRRLPTPWRAEIAPRRWRWKWLQRRTASRVDSHTGTRVLGSQPRLGAMAALAAVAMLSLPASAATRAARAIPENARASDYGSGWECQHGFRTESERCVAVVIPANAYLDASGTRWRCDRGFLQTNAACARVAIPANAFLDDSRSSGWRCERRFREANGACAAIVVPANAHEVDSSWGDGWTCDHGYALKSGACERVRVPANAYLARLGDDWKCERGYAQSGTNCVAISLPTHAFLNSQGNGWACERGFLKTGAACQAVTLPANAHLDYTGERWRCNSGFIGIGGACAKE